MKDSDDKNIFHYLKTVKELLRRKNRRQLAIQEMEDVTGLIIRRMTEYLSADSNNDVRLYRSADKDKKLKLLIKFGGSENVRTKKDTRKSNEDACTMGKAEVLKNEVNGKIP